MAREKKATPALRLLLAGLSALCFAYPAAGQLPISPPPAESTEPVEPVVQGEVVLGGGTAGLSCATNDECNDLQGCTDDFCADGTCVNTLIPDCVTCRGVYVCPPVDLVFVMDTSGSMRDEALALCMNIEQVVTDLAGLGIVVNPAFLGITEAPGDSFSCLTNHVVGLLGPDVPGNADACPFPNTFSSYESWGPATAIVAQRYPWTPGATRLVVPISDEGPCDGSRPEGCNDPGDDRSSIENAIAIAAANGVIVSPIAGTGSDLCVLNLATAVANGTGGVAAQSKSPKVDFANLVTGLIMDRCSLDDRCDDGHICTTNDRCVESACVGTPIDGCAPCMTAAGCDDLDDCTTDACVEGLCLHELNYDDSTECCAPNGGTIRVIDDGNACTLDVCDPQTGLVTHPPAPTQTTCVDSFGCTLDDHCDGAGQCTGTEAGTIECSSADDCFGYACDLNTNRCLCGEIPEVCLVPVPSKTLSPGCFSTDEDIFVDIRLGSSTEVIVGGQFLIGYDPAVLDFVGVVAGAFLDFDSPFGQELMRAPNEAEGTLFYAVGVPLGEQGTRGPALMARLEFRALQGCSSDQLCFLDKNPQRTLLTNSRGQLIPFTTCCTETFDIQGGGPALTCPSSRTVNADPGGLSAVLTWQQPTASSECEGSLMVGCSGTNSFGADVNHLAGTGGRIPAGTTQFNCTAMDACGASATCSWTVDVLATNTVEVDVQLSPVMSPVALSRCIVFEFYPNCVEEPVVVERTLNFGPPFNLAGRADNILLEVPAGEYECVTARDPRHTLRSVTNLSVSGNRYLASFVGDPRLGGHWLIGGNLDGNNVIDEMDEALLESKNGTSISPHTPCGSPGIHADINGDGQVNTSDLAFIQRNFLVTQPVTCCGNP